MNRYQDKEASMDDYSHEKKLAHNAPNPQGIINCVYGHYPSLKAQRENKKK
ncbi:hypothetical protein H8D85_02655 [bacterium]|nr:hypothetical protein [bacterium]